MIKLSDHFTYKRLLRFTLPSIIMMVFSSIYGVVDGIIVSNFVGKTAFAAINLMTPFIMVFSSLGFMIGAGGSALISKTLGEGNKNKANEIFSLLVYFTTGIGIVCTIVGLLFCEKIAIAFGAEGELLECCVEYSKIIIPMITLYMLQNTFQSFFIVAEKPKIGLIVIIIAGVLNMVLDCIFVIGFNWGLKGAAFATAICQGIGGVIPIIYFSCKNMSLLKLGKTKLHWNSILKTITNGSSEFVTNVSMSIVNILYNFQLMRFAGEDGVAAYGVIMYVNFIFISIILGYAMGSAPIVGYHFGAKNIGELKNLRKKDIVILSITGVSLTIIAELLSYPLAKIFVGYDLELFNMTKNAFRLYVISYLFVGFNIVGSSFFTALNNGFVSAAISFLRTLVFEIACVLLLPMLLGINGIWLAIVIAEILSFAVTIFFFFKYKPKYMY